MKKSNWRSNTAKKFSGFLHFMWMNPPFQSTVLSIARRVSGLYSDAQLQAKAEVEASGRKSLKRIWTDLANATFCKYLKDNPQLTKVAPRNVYEWTAWRNTMQLMNGDKTWCQALPEAFRTFRWSSGSGLGSPVTLMILSSFSTKYPEHYPVTFIDAITKRMDARREKMLNSKKESVTKSKELSVGHIVDAVTPVNLDKIPPLPGVDEHQSEFNFNPSFLMAIEDIEKRFPQYADSIKAIVDKNKPGVSVTKPDIPLLP